MNVTALIPVKSFSNAKQRLSPLLERARREILAEAMFRDVLAQVLGAHGLVQTVVVCQDDRVAAIAEAAGARVMREDAEHGQTSAVDFARNRLKGAGCEAVLIMPGDMPLVRSADVELVLAQLPQGHSGPFALLVPSHDRLGTNALLLAPPDVVPLRFGYDSFTYHLSQLSERGLPVRFMENDHFALDIDEPKDLERFLACSVEDSETLRTVQRFISGTAGTSGRAGEA